MNGRSKSPENVETLDVRKPAAVESRCSPPQSVSSVQSTALTSASSQLSTQYSQFLESVRGFQPLLADLNASIASVTNSVSTMDSNVGGGVKPSNGVGSVADTATSQHNGGSGIWLHSPVVMRSSGETDLTPGSVDDSPELRASNRRGACVVGI